MADEIVEPETEETVEFTPPEESGQEPEETAELETEETPEPEEVVAKTFTQEELEAEIGKRLARERRKQEREQAALAEPIPLEIESKLDPNSFTTTEEYIEALSSEKADAIVSHRDQNRSANAVEEKYQTQVDKALDKYPDFVQVAHSHRFMTNEMAVAIKSSDIATELAYHLGANLEEAERIYNLPPVQQVKALGKLEGELEANPTKAKVSAAPTPITPVQKGKTTNPAYDTTDPRSSKTMTASEWITADRARRTKLYSAQGYK